MQAECITLLSIMTCCCCTCIVTKTASDTDCDRTTNATLLTSSSGLVSSRLSPSNCPWIIRVKPYQHINISIVDFHASEPPFAHVSIVSTRCIKNVHVFTFPSFLQTLTDFNDIRHTGKQKFVTQQFTVQQVHLTCALLIHYLRNKLIPYFRTFRLIWSIKTLLKQF